MINARVNGKCHPGAEFIDSLACINGSVYVIIVNVSRGESLGFVARQDFRLCVCRRFSQKYDATRYAPFEDNDPVHLASFLVSSDFVAGLSVLLFLFSLAPSA